MTIIGANQPQMEHETQAAEKTTKAKTSQEAGFGVNVRLATDDDFMTIIGAEKPTFVMFYASWCGHCSTVKPAFSKLSTTMKEKGHPVQVIAIDAAENPKTADFAGVEMLPTFKIFAAGQLLAVYDGDRSYDDMLKFCQQHEKK
ncbi:thioredoxin domain-containing protein [Phthorimaea operculella]|nr:thioredoxin domain-containing protein [Phthorimaea operculella]